MAIYIHRWRGERTSAVAICKSQSQQLLESSFSVATLFNSRVSLADYLNKALIYIWIMEQNINLQQVTTQSHKFVRYFNHSPSTNLTHSHGSRRGSLTFRYTVFSPDVPRLLPTLRLFLIGRRLLRTGTCNTYLASRFRPKKNFRIEFYRVFNLNVLNAISESCVTQFHGLK